MTARPFKAALRVTALLSVAAGAVWVVASAGANHVAGATYDGTVTGAGSIRFALSKDGSSVVYLSTPPVPGATCTYPSIKGEYDVPITNHQFNDSSPPIYFSGTFGGNQSASGTFRIDTSGCGDTGNLSWSATVNESALPMCKGKLATLAAGGPGLAPILNGTNGKDVIVGSSGKETINARGGNDTVCGKGGNDTLKGGGGNDKLFGEAGKDTLKGGPGKDKLNGGAGDDKQIQ
jgi:Ca2+-binding RTX toxin-like protein